MWNLLKTKRPQQQKKDQKLILAIRTIVGFRPSNIELYRLATLHRSGSIAVGGYHESNERLEFLGDAILSAAIADYLFMKYPFKDEGFLTEIRSRIVNRESLNLLARKIGIHAIVQTSQGPSVRQAILGNTLEAIVGAVYLDKGYLRCKKFIIEKLILPYFDLNVIVNSNMNFKSKIVEWSQQNNKEIRFAVALKIKNKGTKEFVADLFVNEQLCGQGFGQTKKKAEQDAAQKACAMLNVE